MKLPRNLNGVDLAKSLCQHWGYIQVHQTGSHIILDTEDPSHQRIAIPAHKSLRVGTLNHILKSIAHHKQINRQDILCKI